MIATLTPPALRPQLPARPSGLRLAPAPRATLRAPAAPARPEPSADEFRAQAQQILLQACRLGRLDAIVAVAQEAAQLPGGTGAQRSLWDDLAQLQPLTGLQPATTPEVDADSLWLLRRADGSLIELLRLRGSGLVGLEPHPSRTSWRATAGGLLLATLDGEPSSRFHLQATLAGRRVLIGLAGVTPSGGAPASEEVQILTEVDCAYSRLRMIDPELTNPIGGLFRSSELADPGLPPVPVVVLAAARTGSHLLLNLLNTSDRAFIDGEIFNADKIALFGQDLPPDRKDGLDLLRLSDPVRFAKVLMTRSHHVDGRRIAHIPVRGFKLFPEQARPVFDWAMDEPQMHIVHLHRANLLAEFSSYLVAMRDQAWVGGAQATQRQRLLFDSERFLRFVDMKQRYLASLRERLAQRAGPWAEIEYSEICEASVSRLITALTGAPPERKLSTLGLTRQLNERVLDRFANPDAVQRCLDRLGQEGWAGAEVLDLSGFDA